MTVVLVLQELIKGLRKLNFGYHLNHTYGLFSN